MRKKLLESSLDLAKHPNSLDHIFGVLLVGKHILIYGKCLISTVTCKCTYGTIACSIILNKLVLLPATVIYPSSLTLEHSVSVPHVVLEMSFVYIACQNDFLFKLFWSGWKFRNVSETSQCVSVLIWINCLCVLMCHVNILV